MTVDDRPPAADGAELDEDRQLCDDGNCLGVVVDGRCNVCGLVATGASGDARDDVAPDGPRSFEAIDAPASTADTFDPADRQLCPDGACTGLVGSDGKCRECGRPAAS